MPRPDLQAAIGWFQLANAVGFAGQAPFAFTLGWVDQPRYISFLSIWALVLAGLVGFAQWLANRQAPDQIVEKVVERTEITETDP